MKRLASILGLIFLGVAGSLALLVALAGFLAYWAPFFFLVFAAAEVVGAVQLIAVGGRWLWMYVLGNLGILVANTILGIMTFIDLAARRHPDPTVWAPLSLGLILTGLSAGITAGALKRLPTAR